MEDDCVSVLGVAEGTAVDVGSSYVDYETEGWSEEPSEVEGRGSDEGVGSVSSSLAGSVDDA